MIWLLGESDRDHLEKQLGPLSKGDLIARPRISTADSVAASFFVGSTVPRGGTNIDVGIDFRIMPMVRKEFTRLTMGLISTVISTNHALSTAAKPTIETNVFFHAHIRVPKRNQVLIVSKAEHKKPPVCILIWAKTPR
jgi:hypothetical protein